MVTVMTQGLIKADYEMFGHRDGRLNTSCPGDDLYAYIHGWPHYSTRPIHKYGAQRRSSASSRNSVASRQFINIFTSDDSSDGDRDDSVVQQL